MALEKWSRRGQTILADMKIFTLSRLLARSPRTGEDRDVALIETGDWVNVVALTPSREVILVEQYRHGTDAITLEIPGGLVDPGESPQEAAVRELREETGYTGGRVTELGVVEPNPAFLTNRCFTYLVEDCQSSQPQELDEGEDIEVSTMPLDQIPEVIREGRIAHALVICGFWWLCLRRSDLLELRSL